MSNKEKGGKGERRKGERERERRKGEREKMGRFVGKHAAGVRLCITVCKRSAAYGS
ncbi:hypothetical protein M2134_002725, partial [Parabacteroides sp. PM6-13]|nr:hypothetical protein [Parabacteroides sp. PM6-13]